MTVVDAHGERSRCPCEIGSVAPQYVEAELEFSDGEGGGARGGGGVSAVLAGPPFLQREKRLVPLFAIQIIQCGHKTALWMHLDVCNDCCGWHASVFWTPILWTQ
ncbi:hypothetical protein PFLUV_G00263360 [Perca fluviatilis]|uniref:Uncharacterized protein n=1 Tax=Perca fluviatilis TaxID=8168 RepID=A0A6A5EEI4_PERFL|nr:hypothetical protein PFLUV_G00263360 [Perca fluviatilis]